MNRAPGRGPEGCGGLSDSPSDSHGGGTRWMLTEHMYGFANANLPPTTSPHIRIARRLGVPLRRGDSSIVSAATTTPPRTQHERASAARRSPRNLLRQLPSRDTLDGVMSGGRCRRNRVAVARSALRAPDREHGRPGARDERRHGSNHVGAGCHVPGINGVDDKRSSRTCGLDHPANGGPGFGPTR